MLQPVHKLRPWKGREASHKPTIIALLDAKADYRGGAPHEAPMLHDSALMLQWRPSPSRTLMDPTLPDRSRGLLLSSFIAFSFSG